eukprot:g6542.t1
MKKIVTPSEQRTEFRKSYPQKLTTDNFPIQYELLASHEKLQPPNVMESEVPRQSRAVQEDAGAILAPEAWEALRAHLESKTIASRQNTAHSIAETKRPVLVTNTGPYLVAPTTTTAHHQISRTPSQRTGASNPVLFTTPERRISLQQPIPPPALLVQSARQQYQILGRTEGGLHHPQQSTILEGRMLSQMDLKSSIPLHQQKTAIQQKPQQKVTDMQQQGVWNRRPMIQELKQSLMEGTNLEKPKTLVAAVESLKNQFLSGDCKSPPIEGEPIGQPEADLPTNHKRRKNSRRVPPIAVSLSTKTGLDLLLHAAQLSGDALPSGADLEFRTEAALLPFDSIWSSFGAIMRSFIGVYPLLDGSFIARCRYRGSYIQIGTFSSAEHAARAYDRVVLSLPQRHSKTNYPASEYLTFELGNARRAFEVKYKQCQQTRRGSAWPWARAAQTLLANDDEEDMLISHQHHDYMLNKVPELVQDLTPLTETLSGESVFNLLQNVMLQQRDLAGTFDLIQIKIRQLQQRIQSGLSTEKECSCVGQYVCVASILSSLVSMQRDWEQQPSKKQHQSNFTGQCDPLMIDSSQVKELVLEKNDQELSCVVRNPLLSKLAPCVADSVQEEGDSAQPSASTRSDQLLDGSSSVQRLDCANCPYTESIRWVRLLASSLWPRKRGGGMLWKAFQPLFKSSHHRNSILKLREELFIKSTEQLSESKNE